MLQGINVILFTVESLYSLSPNIYIVFAAVLWEGLLGGAAYVNTFHKISVKVFFFFNKLNIFIHFYNWLANVRHGQWLINVRHGQSLNTMPYIHKIPDYKTG